MEKSCRIIFPQRPQDAPQEVYLFDGTTARKVPLPGMNFSEAIKLPAGDLVLSMTAGAVSKPADVPQDAPQAKIPAGMTDFYLGGLQRSRESGRCHCACFLSMPATAISTPDRHSGSISPRTASTGDMRRLIIDHSSERQCRGKRLRFAANGYFKAKFRYQPGGSGDFLPVMEKSWWFDARKQESRFRLRIQDRLSTHFHFPGPDVPSP